MKRGASTLPTSTASWRDGGAYSHLVAPRLCRGASETPAFIASSKEWRPLSPANVFHLWRVRGPSPPLATLGARFGATNHLTLSPRVKQGASIPPISTASAQAGGAYYLPTGFNACLKEAPHCPSLRSGQGSGRQTISPCRPEVVEMLTRYGQRAIMLLL